MGADGSGLVIVSTSVAQTQEVGRKMGELLPAGSLVLLNGELGAGKTALTHGIARGLGVAEDVPVTSPTYTLMNSYDARVPFYHFDLYRLGDSDELIDLGFDDYFHGDGVAVVEWAERCPDLAADALSVDITYIDEFTRSIAFRVRADHPLYSAMLKIVTAEYSLSDENQY